MPNPLFGFDVIGNADGEALNKAVAALSSQRRTSNPTQKRVSSTGKTNVPTIQFHIDPRAQAVSRRKLNTLLLYAENFHKIQAKEMTNLGNRALRMVRMRTKHGKDKDGNAFAKLSTTGASIVKADESATNKKPRKNASTRTRFESYSSTKKRRIANGTNSIPTGSSPPPKANLYATGRLFNSLVAHKSGRITPSSSGRKGKPAPGIVISVAGDRNRKIAVFHTDGTKHAPARPFLGLTRGEQVILTNTFLREVRTGLDKQLLRARSLR